LLLAFVFVGCGYEASSLILKGATSTTAALPAVLLTDLVNGYLLKICLSLRMLREEVLAVEHTLTHQSITAARLQISRIAGRDPNSLSELEIRETAIESLAENLNDSVVAPLFWFAVAGLPGALLYRFANTADAMWGKRGHYEWTGKWAARFDDVLSFIPARLTAILISSGRHIQVLRREAQLTESPNGGWPMAAMALRLGVHLGRPGYYVLNAAGRDVRSADVPKAISHSHRVVIISAVICTLLALMVHRP
jgi:adenosylcobinamide-phosphate synthase